jgi:hypothetical protein
MHLTQRCFLWLLLVFFVACSKDSKQEGAETAAPSAAQAPAAATESAATAIDANQVATTLAELTQAVRKYGAEKQRVPKDLNELVAAGYLPGVPTAPPGKKYAIDQRMQVYLADQ